MKLAGCLVTLLAVAVLCAPADAQCRISYGYAQSYYAPTYTYQAYTPTYQATQVLAVPVIVPAYGVGYGAAASSYVANDDVRALKDRLDRAEQRSDFLMQLLSGQRQPPPATLPQQAPKQPDAPQQQSKAPNGVHPGVAVAAQKCASCHDATTKQKGGGVMLTTAGQRATITDTTYKALARAIIKGTMPPATTGVKLADDEGTALLDAYAQ